MSNTFNATKEVKIAQNTYYHTIQKAKKEYWQNFL